MKVTKMIALLVALVLCSCGARKATEAQLQQIDNYLWEVTVEDYLQEAPNELIDVATADFGCSAARNGNFYGRNLDFFVSEVGEVVVHTPNKDGRYASVGVARLMRMTDEELAKGVTKEQLAVLPWGMFDGINEHGLFCNMNVVSYEDCGENPGTNPGMPDLYEAFLVRALLDNCRNVDEAIDYVNSHNMIGKDMGGYNLHYMIGDPEKTVILEFIDNKAVFVTDPEQASIMTNFIVSGLPEYNEHADGVERYDILREHYAEGAVSADSMYHLLWRVRFSQAYDPTMKPFWKSEFVVDGRSGYWYPTEQVLAEEGTQHALEKFAHFQNTGEYKAEDKLWFTEHVSIYDIAKRELTVTVHENYGTKYTFSL